MKGFPNLATRLEGQYEALIAMELQQAGIEVVQLPSVCRYGECKTLLIGTIEPWHFKRAWRYWVAEGPGIPPDVAERLHKDFGNVVRVDGHCACPSPLEWHKGFAVGMYHVDTPTGLKALADIIKEVRVDG